MEKKKDIWHFNPFRALFGHRNFNRNFLWGTFGSKFSSFGFSLTELLIVIGAIGITVASLIVVFNPQMQLQKARDEKRKSDLNQIQKVLETYRGDFGQYPAADTSTSSYKIKTEANMVLDWGITTAWQYMPTLPKDPSASRNYVYYSSSGGQSYYLYASLERGVNDGQACKSNGSACNNVPEGASCGTKAICNYGVSSPNVSP